MNALQKLYMRRTYIVDRKFQLNVLVRSVSFVVFMLLVMSVTLFVPLIRAIQGEGLNRLDRSEKATTMLYMHEHFWPVALLCLVVATLGSIHISHRIAGPMVRVKRIMRSVIDGVFPKPLRTRDHDYMQDEVAVLNQLVQSVGTRIESLQDSCLQLQIDLARCSRAAGRTADNDLRTALDAATAQAELLREKLEYYTFEGRPTPTTAGTPPADNLDRTESRELQLQQ
ncbi:MAG: hypothetical protein KDC87_08130 [Planctomycetes bacterium]|nr:hypothetical protein [Planctomycetota bacterium]MCB9870068.1 hypothetical protein [Planctomycetota bacterium]MCB9889503.1 hypothetical protein [Planctomycetota bacterium]